MSTFARKSRFQRIGYNAWEGGRMTQLVMLMLVLAQGDAMSGIAGAGAGWAGAGLLGMVLSVLFFKVLPDRDNQLREVLASHATQAEAREARHDAIISALVARYEAMIVALAARAVEQDKERRSDFRGALDALASAHERQLQIVMANMTRDLGQITTSIMPIRDTLQELHDLLLERNRDGRGGGSNA